MGFERNSSRLIAGAILVCQAGPFPLRQHCCTTSPAGARRAVDEQTPRNATVCALSSSS